MRVLAGIIALMGAASAMAASQASFPGAEKLSPWVTEHMALDTASMPLMIMLKDKADLSGARGLATKEEKGQFVYDALRNKALTSQASLLTFLTEKNVKLERFHIVNMIAVYDVSADLVREIAARADVDKVLGNPTFHGLPLVQKNFVLNDAPDGVEASITSTGAPKVWEELHRKGEGAVVASQDTGVQWDHPALKNQYRGWNGSAAAHDYNWYDAIQERIGSATNPCGAASQAPCDDNAHGTHTVGTMVGDDGASNKIGMAPGAKWIACRNMDNGDGRPTTYIKCFEFFLAPFPMHGNSLTDGKPDKAPDVINNSWGCPVAEGCTGTEMKDVLIALKASGIVTVASAGNEGSGCSSIGDQPATHSDETLSVGAHDNRTGAIASFSSRGPSKIDNQLGPDLSAPGVSIRSSVPGSTYEGGYSGTSMAGPHVVGAVALVLSVKPQLRGNVQAIFDLFATSATPKTSTQTCAGVPGTQIPNNTFGHGLLDVYKAAKATL